MGGPTPGMTWSFCVLPGTAASVSRAREFVAEALGGDPRVNDVVLAVSELVTNAVRHTWSSLLGGKVVVLVISSALGARVVVVDLGSVTRPVVSGATRSGELSEGGIGLAVVAELASDWGSADLPGGHAVWADFTRWPFSEDPRALIIEILALAGVELGPVYRPVASFRSGPWQLAVVIDDRREGAHVAGRIPRMGTPGVGVAEFFDDPDMAMWVFLDLVGELASGLVEEL